VDADPVVLADLGATQAAEIALGLVRAGVLIGEREAVIDALRLYPSGESRLRKLRSGN
jgi:hypothetical protein